MPSGRPLRPVLALLLLGAALALAACGGSGTAGSSSGAHRVVPMTVAINPWVGYGPWYVAKAKGFDRANGVDLQFVDFVEDKDIAAAVASGRLDTNHALVSSALRYEQQRIGLKTVLFQDNSVTADAVVASRSISSIAGLRGKTIGFEAGGGGQMLFVKALAQAGMTLRDVHVVNVPAASAGAALISGKVDAAATYEPYLSELAKRGRTHVLATAGQWPGIISDIWQVSDRFAAQHPATVVGALRAWDEGVKFFRTHPDQALQILAAQAKTDVATQRIALNGVKLYDSAESLAFLRSRFTALAADTLKVQQQIGGIAGNPDPAGLADTSFLQRATSGAGR